jgi:hypothetical protein
VIRLLQTEIEKWLHVPRQTVERARTIAETVAPAWHRRITFVAIEDFVAANILELAHGNGQRFFGVLEQILRRYNEAVAHYETDASLRIELE